MARGPRSEKKWMGRSAEPPALTLPFTCSRVPLSRLPVVSTMTSVPGRMLRVLPEGTVVLPVSRMFSSGPQIRPAPESVPESERKVGVPPR